jgi:hypothetical protein
LGRITIVTAYFEQQQDIVETSSRVHAWWLNWFEGYKLVGKRLYPRRNFLGGIAYERVWLLKPGERASA